MYRIPLMIEGKEFLLSPGTHNELQAAIIMEFAPRFVSGGQLLYVGDTEDKDLYIKKEILNKLKLPITEHSKLPDIIIYDNRREWLFLIEVVTSHGPISATRLIELEDFTKDCPCGIVYVTAFPNNKEFRRHSCDITVQCKGDTTDSIFRILY